MAKRCACVLDIGSSKITAMIGERGVNNTFNIHGTGEMEYAGFYDGEFVEPENLEGVVASVITKAETNSGIEIDSLYVGVPAEFSYSQCKEASLTFKKRTKIGNDEVFAFFDLASSNVDIKDNVVINRSPIFFLLDDNRKCMEPRGQVTTRLSGQIGFIFAENEFIRTMDNIFKKMKIEQVEYVSSVLSEALYLLNPEVRDTGAILIDSGYITTSVALVKGDGLLGLNAFSIGGGHISVDLSEVLKITFKEAESLKRKVVLSLDASDSDFYEITTEEGVTPVSAKLTNEIVGARLDMVAGMINRCLISLRGDFNGYLPIYLTGGGICYLKGGKDYLSKAIGSNIEIVSAPVPQLNRPHFSSVLGLLDLALTHQKMCKVSFKDKIKNMFKR